MCKSARALNGLKFLAISFVLLGLTATESNAIVVFSDDFDGGQTTSPGVSAAYSGITTTESVQNYAGLGPSGNQFGGSFLRNVTGGSPTGTAGTMTTLTLTGLPAHTSVDVGFLLGTLDTWDGITGSSGTAPDYFNVLVDGTEVFEASFAQQSGFGSGYSAPAGGLLSGFSNLFNGAVRDGAYNMEVEPALNNIAHTSSTLEISFIADGAGWQGASGGAFGGLLDADESWAIDNLRVSVTAVPEPSSFILLGLVASGLTCRWLKKTLGRSA